MAAIKLQIDQPKVNFLILEKNCDLDSERTWSFHGGDFKNSKVPAWVIPLISKKWYGYEVCFPNKQKRILTGDYYSIHASEFSQYVKDHFASNLLFDSEVARISKNEVYLASGEKYSGACLVDGRGFFAAGINSCAYQKFVGLFLELDKPHGLVRPILMDADVRQIDGYRFFYVLPFSETRLLVEDTRFSESPELSIDVIKKEIYHYCDAKLWQISREISAEKGVLPLPYYGTPCPISAPAAKAGIAAGHFHPTTGYSICEAFRFAEWLSQNQLRPSCDQLAENIADYSKKVWSNYAFYRRLNNMFFMASPAHLRYKTMQKFYNSRETLVERFYSGRLNFLDYITVLSGKPPVPMFKGIRSFLKKYK